MKKKIASLLAIAMLTGTLCVPSFAADSAIKQSDSGFFYIEASGDQIALSAHSADKFIQTDGLYFKDLNGNGTLDVYEDWRQDVDACCLPVSPVRTAPLSPISMRTLPDLAAAAAMPASRQVLLSFPLTILHSTPVNPWLSTTA